MGGLAWDDVTQPSRGFFRREETEEERQRKKPLVAGDTNLTIRYDRCHENRLTSNQ